jgi:hypothetical protein
MRCLVARRAQEERKKSEQDCLARVAMLWPTRRIVVSRGVAGCRGVVEKWIGHA